jgi:FkbM family methyltransferase
MFYSQFEEDKLINDFLIKNNISITQNIFEIGAAEVSRNSNSRFFIETKGFEGFLFEPNPEFNEKLKVHYKNNSKVKIEPFAISNIDGEVSFDLQEDYTLSGIKENGNTKIQSKRLKTYLKENNLPEKIGILSIDTEGYDSTILKSILDDNLSPEIVVIESSSSEESKLQHDLLEVNYKKIFSTGRGEWATKNIFLKVFRKAFKVLHLPLPLRAVNTIWILKGLVKNI